MPENVKKKLGSQEGYSCEYLSSRTTVLLAPGQFALKPSLLTSYNRDTVSAKRFHCHLNQPSIFVQLL